MFLKDISLNKFMYLSFTISGQMNFSGKKLISLFMAYQWMNIRCLGLMAFTELVYGSRELKDIVSTVSTEVVIVLIILKSIRFASRNKQLRNLFERLENIRQIMLNDEINKHFVSEAETLGRKILPVVFLSIALYPIPAFLVNTSVDFIAGFKEKNLFLKVWIPWNRDTVLIHILSNALVMFMTSLTISVYATYYVLEITFALYITAYIKSLQNNLINKGIKNEEIYKQHKAIIQLISDYNKLLSGHIYIETIISPLMPCGYGLVFFKALQKKEISQMIDNFERAIICLMPAFISCGCGQQIIIQMERLHEATYLSNWYDEKPKIRRDLLIMMIRTTNTTAIHYRLFITYDHILLAAVLKVIYSYFMLIVNLDEN